MEIALKKNVEMDIHQDLRALIVTHGVEKVHATLQEMMRKDYEFLARFFGAHASATVPVTAVPVAVPVAHEQQTLESVLTPTKVKNVKIVVKKSEVEPIPTPEVIAPAPAENTMEQEKKFRSPIEMKEFQRQAVEKKHSELQAKGITPESILTKENLTKWILEEGNSYAWVAREKAGCPETTVSAIAKNYGIISKIKKRQGMAFAKTHSS